MGFMMNGGVQGLAAGVPELSLKVVLQQMLEAQIKSLSTEPLKNRGQDSNIRKGQGRVEAKKPKTRKRNAQST